MDNLSIFILHFYRLNTRASITRHVQLVKDASLVLRAIAVEAELQSLNMPLLHLDLCTSRPFRSELGHLPLSLLTLGLLLLLILL